MRRRDFLRRTALLLFAPLLQELKEAFAVDYSKIRFHWDESLELFDSEKSSIEARIIEAAEEFKKEKHCKPIDLLEQNIEIYLTDKNPLKLKEPEHFYGCMTLQFETPRIYISQRVIQYTGLLLAVAFHEFSHLYDFYDGKMESLREQNELLRASPETLISTELCLKAKQEQRESEVTACRRGIEYVKSMPASLWLGASKEERIQLLETRIKQNS